MKSPAISVIIPVYNTAEYVRETINSIICQTLQEIEIIVINDGSTDKSPEILSELAAQDTRIKLYSQKNQGVSSTRNNGITKANGEFIYLMDSDDLLAPDTLAQCYQRCVKDNLDFVFFDAEILERPAEEAFSLNRQRSKYINPNKVYTGAEIMKLQMDTWGYRASPCLYITRRSYLQRIQLSFYPGIIHEDELYTAKLYLQANRTAYIPESFFKRRLRADSIMTRKFSQRNMDGYLTAIKEILAFAQNQTPEIQVIVKQLIRDMLNAALYKAQALSFRQRMSLFNLCLRHYFSYLKARNLFLLLCPIKL